MRPREAPMATRIPISRRLRAARPSRRLATLAAAISRTRPVAASASPAIGRISYMCPGGTHPRGISTEAVVLRWSAGRSRELAAAVDFTAASASARDAPGASRASTRKRADRREFRAAARSVPEIHVSSGRKTSGGASRSSPANPGAATPRMVKLRPLIDTARPTAAGSPPKRRRQRPAEMTIALRRERSSSAVKNLPAAGTRPRIEK